VPADGGECALHGPATCCADSTSIANCILDDEQDALACDVEPCPAGTSCHRAMTANDAILTVMPLAVKRSEGG
jgi:hypothetical protein